MLSGLSKYPRDRRADPAQCRSPERGPNRLTIVPLNELLPPAAGSELIVANLPANNHRGGSIAPLVKARDGGDAAETQAPPAPLPVDRRTRATREYWLIDLHVGAYHVIAGQALRLGMKD
jgi:hypothetical protein